METENWKREETESTKKKVLAVDFVETTNNVVNETIIESNPGKEGGGVNHKVRGKLYVGYSARLVIKVSLILIFAFISVMCFLSLETKKVIKTSNYQIKGNIDYSVHLKENDYYDTNVLNSNMKYIANLIDNIEFFYDYSFYSPDDYNLKYSYYVTAKLLIYDKNRSKVLYEDEKVVVKKNEKTTRNNRFSLSDSLDIDYDEYNKIANDFTKDYRLYASSEVVYTMYIDVTGVHSEIEEKLVNNNKINLTIPLTQTTVDIALDKKEIKINDNLTGGVKIEKEKNVVKSIGGVVFGVLAIGCLVNVLLFIKKSNRKQSKYSQRVNHLLKEYDRAIAKTKEVIEIREEHNLIEIDSFEGLLDIRDNLNLPILFMEIHKGSKAWFVIKKDNDIYRYVLKGVDLENSNNKK